MTSALAPIRSQPLQYAVTMVAGRKYLLAPRDLLTVLRLNDVTVGDILELDNIHKLGSREYTLRGAPRLSPDAVKITATLATVVVSWLILGFSGTLGRSRHCKQEEHVQFLHFKIPLLALCQDLLRDLSHSRRQSTQSDTPQHLPFGS